MAEHHIDVDTWPRAAQFRFFRTFDRPHYAITARVDASHLMARRAAGLSPYRATIYAIGAGIHAVPELTMRFRGDTVVRHDHITLSMTVPRPIGGINFGYAHWQPDPVAFDADCAAAIAAASANTDLTPASPEADAVAYVSCLPWLDYTALDNAMPNRDDCIPRISWGKIVPKGDGHDMAMTLQVHHALVDGEEIGAYFAAMQQALNAL